MLATYPVPAEFQAWNRRHRSPYGHPLWQKFVRGSHLGWKTWNNRMKLPRAIKRFIGPYGFEAISPTREFEYPWCFAAANVFPGMKALDIGAGAAGLQFTLSQNGVDVTSVDPLEQGHIRADWVFTDEDFVSLNRAFGTDIHFVRKYLQDASYPDNTFDCAFAVSVIEHIPAPAAKELVREIGRVLKPGGKFILTVDLFLDCTPFTEAASNRWGTNISIRELVEASGLELVQGDRQWLHGYPEFSTDRVREQLHRFLVSDNVLAQCFVLRK